MPVTLRRLAAVLFSMSLLALAPAPATAQMEGVKETSKTTFTLVPGADAVEAHTVIKLLNQRKPTTSRGPCQNDARRTCTTKTRYYIAGWSVIVAPPGATDVAITGKRVKPQLLATTSWGSGYSVSFPKLFHRKKQAIDVRYVLPDAGPAADVRTRVADAYARFCWRGPSTDRGTVRAVVPPGWHAVTSGGATATSTSAKGTVVTAKGKGTPDALSRCTDAFLPEALVRTSRSAPGGQTINYDAWPDDPEWTTSVIDIVDTYLPALESRFGSPMPFAELTVQEAARINGFGQPSDMDPALARLMLDEDVDFVGAPVAALARTWFADGSIAEPWLAEGLALWAGLATTGYECPDPGPYPAEGAPDLRDWQVSDVPHYVDPALPAWQATAACSIVQEVADLVGPEHMATVVASLLDGTPRYATGDPGARGDAAGWTDWLDAADEMGLVPAGVDDLEVAERTLVAMGIADAERLAGRSGARALYHQTLEAMDGVALPRFVAALMEGWSFDAAVPAILASRRVYDRITADTAMAEDTRATFLEVFEGADSLEALARLEQAVVPGA